jgi:hypothetical protein
LSEGQSVIRRNFLAFFGLVPTGFLIGSGKSDVETMVKQLTGQENSAANSSNTARELLTKIGYQNALRKSCDRAVQRQLVILNSIDSKRVQELNLTEEHISLYARELEERLFTEFSENVTSSLTEKEIQEGLAFFNSDSGKRICSLFEKLQNVGTPIIDQGSLELKKRFSNS